MADADAIDWTVELFPPESEKLDQRRKFRGDVVVLPKEALQNQRVIWHPVKNLSRCQAVARQSLDEPALNFRLFDRAPFRHMLPPMEG